MQNWRLDDLISNQPENRKLAKSLELVKPRSSTGSLTAYDGFDFAGLYQFRQIFRQETDITITGKEPFPGKMLQKKDNVSLPDDIYELLVQYYNAAYDWEFVTIKDTVSKVVNNVNPEDYIVVLPDVNQYGRIQIGTEFFGSTIAPRYQKNSHILAKFIQSDETIELYPGEVQFFFTHSITLPTSGLTTHSLAFVKWHLPAPDRQTRFYCKTNDDGEYVLCNIDLWKDQFHEIDRDSIIPIHNIYSRFVPSEFMAGIRKLKKYMAVIPINRQFHL
jgi:hypothetical protein